MDNIEYSGTDERDLDIVGDLWKKLNDYHGELSPHHANHYDRMTFEGRKKHLLEKSRNGALRVDLARDTKTNRLVGYCVSTVSETGQGEIDSIYVEAEYRHRGIGDAIMKKVLAWMDALAVTQRMVEVASGNEEVVAFYHRYGFYPRSVILRTPE